MDVHSPHSRALGCSNQAAPMPSHALHPPSAHLPAGRAHTSLLTRHREAPCTERTRPGPQGVLIISQPPPSPRPRPHHGNLSSAHPRTRCPPRTGQSATYWPRSVTKAGAQLLHGPGGPRSGGWRTGWCGGEGGGGEGEGGGRVGQAELLPSLPHEELGKLGLENE